MDSNGQSQNDVTIQDKMNELMAELSDSREDSRNTQNQIFEIMNIVGTVLGMLFGASYLSSDNKNKNFNSLLAYYNKQEDCWIDRLMNSVITLLTPARILFWLSAVAFIVAFLYITYLGIENILRYYHIQNIEDRLYDLMPSMDDDHGRGSFLHWNGFSAPILTKNIKHISSSHTSLSFFAYTGAVFAIIFFSMGLVLSLFLDIDPIRRIDKIILGIIGILMIFTVILFLRLSIRAREVVQFSWDMAHENQRIRLGIARGELYAGARSYAHLIRYLVYPKLQDLQKPMLIALGFLYWCYGMGSSIIMDYAAKLFFVMFIFDFLAYQARYQINDIRGIKEDREAGHRNRLLSSNHQSEAHMIKVSLVVAIFKIVLSIFLTIQFGGKDRQLLIICLLLLLLSTITYEITRDRNWKYAIFIAVGLGYPLRFFLGFFILEPTSFLVLLNFRLVCFILALCAYGSFSSTISWANEITDRIQRRLDRNEQQIFQTNYEKKHYLYIQEKIKDRFQTAIPYAVRNKVLPLREKGKLTDPWNIAFILSMGLMSLNSFFSIPARSAYGWIFNLFEIVVLVCVILSIRLERKNKIYPYLIEGATLLLKMVAAAIIFKSERECVLLCLMQILVAFTYFYLCYRPQFKKVDFKLLVKNIKKALLCKILGEYASNILNP